MYHGNKLFRCKETSFISQKLNFLEKKSWRIKFLRKCIHGRLCKKFDTDIETLMLLEVKSSTFLSYSTCENSDLKIYYRFVKPSSI